MGKAKGLGIIGIWTLGNGALVRILEHQNYSFGIHWFLDLLVKGSIVMFWAIFCSYLLNLVVNDEPQSEVRYYDDF